MKAIIFSFALVLSNAAYANCVSEMMPKTHGDRELAQQMCHLAAKSCDVGAIIKANNGINYADAIALCAKSAAAESDMAECLAQGYSYSTCQQH